MKNKVLSNQLSFKFNKTYQKSHKLFILRINKLMISGPKHKKKKNKLLHSKSKHLI